MTITRLPAEYSIWLLAREDQQQVLRAAVEALADRHDGHRFEPHVTLQGDLAMRAGDAVALLDELAASTPVQHWPVLAVESTGHFFRALYLRLGAGSAFERLLRQCEAHSGTAEGLSPYPHLSLAYGPARGDAASELAQLTSDMSGRALVFDRVALCRSSKLVPIADWRLLDVRPLGGRPG